METLIRMFVFYETYPLLATILLCTLILEGVKERNSGQNFSLRILQFSCMKEERGTEINHGPPLSRRIILEEGPKCNNSSMLFACKVAIFHNISGD